ncbi:MAG: putative iron donor protein [Proteobacteria bacterium]|nr:putative iron donor protein [Pseudomonadota bacterium]
MDEATFLVAAEATMQQLEAAIEMAAEAADVDVDIDLQAGGVLQLTFEDDSQIIINRHAVAREIWVAARSGGFHFRPEGNQWRGTRDGQDLWSMLTTLISQQVGTTLKLIR